MAETSDPKLLPAERIVAAIQLGESHFREFKSALDGPPGGKNRRSAKEIRRDIGETLVGFANADGGDLLLGVEDDGTITGVQHGEEDIVSFLKAPNTNVHPETPLPPPRMNRVLIDSKLVLLFGVEKSTRRVHLTSDGRCVQRRDRETIPVASEQIRFERQEQLSREYDRGFADGADLSAIDHEALRRAGTVVAKGMSPEKLLQLLDLADFGNGARLRRGALLLFARDIQRWHPRSQVRILRVDGTELKAGRDYNVSKDYTITGAVFELMSRAWDGLRPHLVQTRFSSGGLFEERILYPEDACREALTNAIAHRDYSMEGRAIEVLVFDDRMEVHSPGGLLSNVSLTELKKLKGLHQSRNAVVARVLRELGYMREMGEGLRHIFQLMRAQDLVEPELRSDHETFTITLHHRSVFSEAAARWIGSFDKFNLSRMETKAVLLGADDSLFTPRQVFDACGIVDTEDYRILIESLRVKGLLVTTLTSKKASSNASSRNVERKDVARLKIRRSEECEAFLAELIQACRDVPHDRPLDAGDRRRIAAQLAEHNPYRQNTTRTLEALGLIDQDQRVSPRLRAYIDALPASGRRNVNPSASSGAPARTVAPTQTAVPKTTAPEVAKASPPFVDPTLYVGNLPADMTASDLRGLFSSAGNIRDIRVPTDVFTGRSRGYAFVEFEDVASAKRAMASVRADGHLLSVAWARPSSWNRK